MRAKDVSVPDRFMPPVKAMSIHDQDFAMVAKIDGGSAPGLSTDEGKILRMEFLRGAISR